MAWQIDASVVILLKTRGLIWRRSALCLKPPSKRAQSRQRLLLLGRPVEKVRRSCFTLLATFSAEVASYLLTSRGYPEICPFYEGFPLTVRKRIPSLDPLRIPSL